MWITRLSIQIFLYKYKVKQAEVISRLLFTFITLKLQEYFVQSLTVSKYIFILVSQLWCQDLRKYWSNHISLRKYGSNHISNIYKTRNQIVVEKINILVNKISNFLWKGFFYSIRTFLLQMYLRERTLSMEEGRRRVLQIFKKIFRRPGDHRFKYFMTQ